MKDKAHLPAEKTPGTARLAQGARIRTGVLAALLLGLGLVFCCCCLAQTAPSAMAPLASCSLLLDAAAFGDRICAVGDRGHVLLSEDGGHSWRQVQVPTRAMLTGVAFQGNGLGCAVGHDTVILRTVDSGEHWEKVLEDPDACRPLFDVWFGDGGYGFAIGAYGLCLRTQDGGQTWSPVKISQDEWHLYHMARSATGKLYIAAEAGNLYRSDDSGNTWKNLPSPYNGSFFGVIPLDGDALIAFGLRGHVFSSSDAGESWRPEPTGTIATLANGARLADGRIVLAGLGGVVLVSSKKNSGFKLMDSDRRSAIWALIENTEQELLCFGENGANHLALDLR